MHISLRPRPSRSRRSLGPHGPRLLAILIVAAVLLSGCSTGNDSAKPTEPSSQVVGPAAPTASLVGVSSSAASDSAGSAGGPRVVGDLVQRVGSAWQGVRSYRAVTRQGTGDIQSLPLPGTPVNGALAGPTEAAGTQVVVDEVMLPDRRHYLESDNGSVSEYVAAGGRVYARGRFAQVSIRPDLDATTWVNLDPAFISADSPVGQFIAQFAGASSPAFAAPLADLQSDTRALELTDVGMVDVGGRACHAYQWKQTGQTGDLMTRVVSVDAVNLPCSLTFDSGSYHSETVWDQVNVVADIQPPADWVTVGATINMADATPEGIDINASPAATEPSATGATPIAGQAGTPETAPSLPTPDTGP